MAVSGSQFTRIGAYLSGIGKKLVILAKTAATVVDEAVGVLSIINTHGKGVQSTIKSSEGVQSTIMPTVGVISNISTHGVGVRSTITSHGAGVESGV